MDMQFAGRERFVHLAKVIAIVISVVLVIVLVVSVMKSALKNESPASLVKNTMMRAGSSGNFQTRQDGEAVRMRAPSSSIMSYPKAKGMPTENVAADSISVQGNNIVTADKKVVKTGDLALKVESVEKTMEQIRWVAGQFGGDIFSSSVYDADTARGVKSGLVTIKVPVAHFDEALRSIASVARVVVRETTSGQDVTSEYVDLQARLKNKQTEEEAVSAILTRDTKQIDDVLSVTLELSRVRGEIEQLQAQMKYLDNQAEMSTITVSFTEDVQIGKTDASWRPSQEIKDAVSVLIRAGQKAVSFFISFIIVIVPIIGILLVVFGSILYAVVKNLYRRFHR